MRLRTQEPYNSSLFVLCCIVGLLLAYVVAYTLLARFVCLHVGVGDNNGDIANLGELDDCGGGSSDNSDDIQKRLRQDDHIHKDGIHEEMARFCREKRDAFGAARLPAYSRMGIVIPEWSKDTRECDDFGEARPKECLLEEGYAACFECIESRSSLRVCAHVGESVTIYDDARRLEMTLQPNSSPLLGYCLREALADQLRQLNDAESDSIVVRARHECSIHNGDWVLVRKRATRDARDSSFNFVCRCKYPHLMTNVAGPMSSCSKAVGCGGHGVLDRASRASEVDPFVDGRCLCDDGWIAEYNERNGVGPMCREATIGEWPSLALRRPMNVVDEPDDRYFELHSRFVNAAFRRVLTQSRVDGAAPVYLRNPCYPCPIVATDDGEAYFCGDLFETREDEHGRRVISKAHIGVRGDRDYLSGNGGHYPNACLVVTERQIVANNILVQFMSQSWSKEKFAMEIGLIAKTSVIHSMTRNELTRSQRYGDFLATLQAPEWDSFPDYGVIWTFNDPAISKHRQGVCESLRSFLTGPKHTDLAYKSDLLRIPFPYYADALITKYYYYFPKGTILRDLWVNLKPYLRQEAYNCPDMRGLDRVHYPTARSAIETDTDTAHQIARAMLPVCMVDHVQSSDGARYTRPEINCEQLNESGCLVFQNDGLVTYMNRLWMPRDMRMLPFCRERSGWRDESRGDSYDGREVPLLTPALAIGRDVTVEAATAPIESTIG